MKSINRIGDLERKYVLDVIESQFSSSKSAKYMNLLEKEFARVFEKDFAISFTNGTATMHAVLEAWEIGPGDEVIITPLTMSSTTFCVLQAGATPVYADIDKNTFNIDPSSIKSKISSKSKAIIPVSIFGLSPEMDKIMKIAKEHNLKVLEDNAETFLGYYKGEVVGHFGDAASYSFQSSKHLTAGEGGMIVTDDEEFALNLRRVQSLGYAGVSSKKSKISKDEIQSPNYSRHVTLGWNYRMPELCAAVAYAQTQRIEELVNIRKEAAKIFNESVNDYKEFLTPQFVGPDYENSYWTWVAKIHDHSQWEGFRTLFLNNGGDRFYGCWKLGYQEPFFKERKFLGRESLINKEIDYSDGICPIAEDIQKRLMCFKTNYWDLEKAKLQGEILNKTCKDFF